MRTPWEQGTGYCKHGYPVSQINDNWSEYSTTLEMSAPEACKKVRRSQSMKSQEGNGEET